MYASWTDIKPILGPLIQAAVVLGVGVWTILFQLRQARTAERKLFVDLHDKRYKSLSSLTRDVTAMVMSAVDEDDNVLPQHVQETLARRERLQSRMEELTWLFGSDVIFHLTDMHGRAEAILSTINRLRHHLDSDTDKATDLIKRMDENIQAMYVALGKANDAARHYLYVGHIKIQAPPMPAFTLDQLGKGQHPGRVQ